MYTASIPEHGTNPRELRSLPANFWDLDRPSVSFARGLAKLELMRAASLAKGLVAFA
jgi:hypothetical protein